MGFFQGASNIRISGGEFNLVKGNYNVYDQSRHHTNVNSGNTTLARTQDSHNDHSTNYDNVDPRRMPPLQRPGQRDQGRSDPSNIQDYFPPPAPNPMLYPQNLPPGSRTQNYNSLNINNEDVKNAHNNYSQNYGLRPANAHHGRWNSTGGPPSNSQRGGNRGFPGGTDAFGSSTSPPHSFSPPVNLYNQDRQPNPPFGEFNIPGFPPSVPYVNGRRPGPHNSADVRPGDVTGFTPQMQRSFSQLMQQVNGQFAQETQQPAPMAPEPHQREGFMEDEEEEEEDSESEEERENKRMQDPITGRMSKLSLNEELRPAFSRNKSDPELPQQTETTSANLASPYMDSRQAESTQDLPQRLKEPFVVNPSSSCVPPPHEQRPQAPPPPPSTVPAAFGLPPSALQSGPIFNDIHGDYNKVDQSVNNTNINSLNTHNTLVRDSYNDQSFNMNTAATAEQQNEGRRTTQKQGRTFRRS